MQKIKVGDVVTKRAIKTTEGKQIQIPDDSKLLHLQFRRFAGCPFCSVHLHSLARRHDEIVAAGVREVAVFRSTDKLMRRHHIDMPFDIVADPQDSLFVEFRVSSGLRALLDPRAWAVALIKVVHMLPKLPGIPWNGRGVFGLPADFLIADDGRVLACKYGVHADDQWSVDELLDLARGHALAG